MAPDKKIPRETLADLDAAKVVAGRPLVVVDCDEVIVEFAGHLARWLPALGYRLKLDQYELEGAIYPENEDIPLGFDAAVTLINAFFEEETKRQTPIDGAVAALERLSAEVQVVVLTNIPRHGRADRLINLRDLGLGHLPVIVNSGGKGRALAWLGERVAAPMVFIDDSPFQIASAARHAEPTGRIHFRGAEHVREIDLKAQEADYVVEDWVTCEETVRRRLNL
ncbi:MAG: hypothetical protein AAF565_14090 [Pseudomonadota bacterium]